MPTFPRSQLGQNKQKRRTIFASFYSPAGEPRPSYPARWRSGLPEVLLGTLAAAVLVPRPDWPCTVKDRRFMSFVHQPMIVAKRTVEKNNTKLGTAAKTETRLEQHTIRSLHQDRCKAKRRSKSKKKTSYGSFSRDCGLMLGHDRQAPSKHSKS